jgi:hypothetical protein
MDVPPADEGIEPAAPVQPVAPVNQPMPPSATYVQLPSFQPADQKPGMVQAIAIMTLVNGIFNILYGLSLTMGVVLGTLFIGIICAPVTILPTVLGIFEIVFAVKLLANPPQPVKPSPTIAILEIVTILTGNLISMIVGILALVFYNDANVKAYFARINNQG